tara:strand:- start:964 stop:1515 length:552 start_codon:yes stop_codon:yes gene_type:complete
MAEILMAMLLLGGGAAVIAEQQKKRTITSPVSEGKLRKIKKFLKKSKFFKETDADKIVSIIQKRISGEKDLEEQQEQKEVIKEITEENSVPVSLPQAWCPNDKRTTCSLFDKDKHFPTDCIGDIDKKQCLDRIQKYIVDDNNKQSQLEDYCSRVNDVCVSYDNKQYATSQDRQKCGNLIPNCN